MLYTLDRERTYHFVTGVLVALASLTGWLVNLLTSEAMREEVGSVAGGRVLQAALLLIGVGPLPAWLWWMRRYVRRIVWQPVTKTLRIERCGYFVSAWEVTPSEIEKSSRHEGRGNFPGAPSVNAPYRRVSIAGLPSLIVDEQGTTHDAELLEAMLTGQPFPSDTR